MANSSDRRIDTSRLDARLGDLSPSRVLTASRETAASQKSSTRK